MIKINRDSMSTILGWIVGIALAWHGVDWNAFAWDAPHIMPLVLSAAVIVGGHATEIKKPQ